MNINNTSFFRRQACLRRSVTIAVLMFAFPVSKPLYAGSATWSLNPESSDWNTATNWMPATVPQDGDTATFDISNTTDVTISALTVVNAIVFTPGASAYTISLPFGIPNAVLNVTDSITNNSGQIQQFLAPVDGAGDAAAIAVVDHGSAGAMNTFTAAANPVIGKDPAQIALVDHATAGQSTFISDGGTVDGGAGGLIQFFTDATAESGTFINQGAVASGAEGGATIFLNQTHAASATLIANGSSGGGEGGRIAFQASSTGDTARVELFGNGFLDLTLHSGGLSIGSIEGDGLINLGAVNLSVGANNLNTIFSGVIGDDGFTTGALSKTGTGNLILRGANIYPGKTSVSAGALVVNNTTGSGTGTGTVQVAAGTLGGSGTIAGAVTIGTGGGAGAFLQPSVGTSRSATLTIEGALTFKSDSTYTYKLNLRKAKADRVNANGVTIESSAQFIFNPVGNRRLRAGTSATVINNTSATPISGVFANLADGSTVHVGRNNFQVSYAGGDGNDLTLTVVP